MLDKDSILNCADRLETLDDRQLENLIGLWAKRRREDYLESDVLSGTGDMGIDVVGFLSRSRHEGEWHNYQCKQLARSLSETELFEEVGKVLYYASQGEFTPPTKYVFVAPRDISRHARSWVNRPAAFKAEMLSAWDKRCSRKIITNKSLPLDEVLTRTIQDFDFSRIEAWNAARLVGEPDMRPVLVEVFEIDPGEAPEGNVPPDVQTEEASYVAQLMALYGEAEGADFQDLGAVLAHQNYGPHLYDQRVRFFDATSFRHHFRDNVPDRILVAFEKEIYHGIVDTHRTTKGLDRVNAVMSRAGGLPISGVFGKHNRASITVKQGTCHHFANSRRLPWKA